MGFEEFSLCHGCGNPPQAFLECQRKGWNSLMTYPNRSTHWFLLSPLKTECLLGTLHGSSATRTASQGEVVSVRRKYNSLTDQRKTGKSFSRTQHNIGHVTFLSWSTGWKQYAALWETLDLPHVGLEASLRLLRYIRLTAYIQQLVWP